MLRDIDGSKAHKALREKYGDEGYKEGSEISFLKKDVYQGVVFKDRFGSRYYFAASMYTLPNESNCTVKFNFGPDCEFFLLRISKID
ncbi:hypothetical protein Ahy_A02g008057 [Arachis hypogaea]|uniref:Uncharacterized protein n=1 Tax=Arachis hypogaea TaxID=3818 RepID=A0A445EEE5_ARAHY|nr:hypothetical protein Ahy_A02g008057 [Arachis hypogaea]